MPKAWQAARAVRTLELLAFAPHSAPELADALRVDVRAARGILHRLAQEGYVTQEGGHRRRYHSTMRTVALAAQILENSKIVDRARPYVALLHQRTGAAAHLFMPTYNSVVCVVHCDTDHEAASPRIRELLPAHATAAGKILLAHRKPWCDSILSRPLTRYTDRTTTDPTELRRQLEHARACGYATEDGEHTMDRRAVAAAVTIRLGETVAALTVNQTRIDPQVDVDVVTTMVAELNRHLSAPGASGYQRGG